MLDVRNQADEALTEHKGDAEHSLKRKAQRIIRAILLSAQSLDDLPRKRTVDFRVEYTDDTPDDYQLPGWWCVRALEVVQACWEWLTGPLALFSSDADHSKTVEAKVRTRSLDDVPEAMPFGKLTSNHHS